MGSDSDELFRLLSEEVIPARQSGTRWGWLGGALAATLIVGWLVFAISGGPPVMEIVPAASESGATPADGNAGSSNPTTANTLVGVMYPTARLDAGMAIDPHLGSIVLFGGKEGFRDDPLTDMWVLDADRLWHPVPATLEPPGREVSALMYVESIERIVLVGGASEPTLGCALFRVIRAPSVDVWIFDAATEEWDLPVSSNDPPRRWGHASAYDAGSDRIVLFGGVGTRTDRNNADLLGDTWVYDPSDGSWEEVDSPLGPEPRACAAMAYDPVTSLSYLWGGQIGMSTSDPVLWAFDSSSLTWGEVTSVGESVPTPRWSARMVYEPVTHKIYLIGGVGRFVETTDSGTMTQVRATDEVWAFDPVTGMWEQRRSVPEASGSLAAAADGRGSIVAFLGASTLVYDATANTWTDITPYDLLDVEE